MMMQFVFDIETDGFDATKIHCLSAQAVDEKGKIHSTDNYGSMRTFFYKEETWFIGHNIMRFDVPQIEKILNLEVNKDFCIDTLFLAWYLFPEHKKQGLEDWGERFGYPKVKVDDEEWKDMSFDRAKERCERDVEINMMLWRKCMKKLMNLYSQNVDKIKQLIKYLMFKARCAAEAEKNGWQISRKIAQKNLDKLEEIKSEKFEALKEYMPKVWRYAPMQRPKNLFKKDGALTAAGERWYYWCNELKLDPETTDRLNKPIEMIEPNPGSTDQVKDWLFSLGWVPDEFKLNDKGNKVPQINTQDPDRKGEVSDSVLALRDKAPEAIDALAELSVLKARVPMLRSFLTTSEETGRTQATIGGLTNTLRFKHSGCCCNIPGVSALFGEYIRPVMVASKGMKLMGADVSSLEDRTKQHFMWKHDPEYVKTMMQEDFDPHLDLAVIAGAMSPDDAEKYKQKIEGFVKVLKPIRTKYKTTNYTCTYNGGVGAIAAAANIPHNEAKKLYDTYWKRNHSLKKIADEVVWKYIDESDQMWLLNPINGFWYSLRADKDKFSTLNQGTGSYAFDTWLAYVLTSLGSRARLLGQFHDEFIFEVDKKDDEEDLTRIVKSAMDRVNSVLKLNRDLDCEVQFGDNYGEIH